MKRIFSCVFFLVIAFCISAQNKTDSLKKLLTNTTNSTARAALLVELSKNYYLSKPDSGLDYANEALTISKKTGDIKGEMRALSQAGFSMFLLGNYPAALQTFIRSQHIATQLNDKWSIARNYDGIGCVFARQNENELAVEYALKSLAVFRQIGDYDYVVDELMSIGHFCRNTKKYNLALQYSKQALNLSVKMNETRWRPQILSIIGVTYSLLNDEVLALNYMHQSEVLAKKYGQTYNLIETYVDLAQNYQRNNQRDSSITYAKKAYNLSQKGGFTPEIFRAADLLAKLYFREDDHLAVRYYKIANDIKDSLLTTQKAKEVLIINITEQQHETDLKNAEKAYQSSLKLYSLLVVLALAIIILVIFWINNKRQQRANLLLAQQKQQVQQTLKELKQTQAQLIQSEKMASLGELTAGIAHEIQNPLNFVNNFSEVNAEMLEELKAESAKPKAEQDEQLAMELINNLIGNEEKINHHGKRADSIVKGMLEHSRTSTGEKQLTDINTLAEEFLKLSYHGLRAKDKNFNAELITHFDKNLPKINIVQQDIGRVLLNLFNNAFYAVNEKAVVAVADYKPTVMVSTCIAGAFLLITVRDNGAGIPQKILDKIYQPFFTTKPAGQGTGLGLSLSYDIVKANGGNINVETLDGIFTQFNVQLPLI